MFERSDWTVPRFVLCGRVRSSDGTYRSGHARLAVINQAFFISSFRAGVSRKVASFVLTRAELVHMVDDGVDGFVCGAVVAVVDYDLRLLMII